MSDVLTENEARPTQLPPGATEGAGATTAEPPRELEELAGDILRALTADAEAAPSVEPPAVTAAAEGIGAWQSNKTVNALFVTAAPRNSWLHIASPSVWRRLAPVSDSGVAAMTMLAAHARDRNRPATFREEADNLVHEIYVW